MDSWSNRWRLPRGALLSLEHGLKLARAWYGPDRRDPAWRRHSPVEAEALFATLGLTTPFWNLR